MPIQFLLMPPLFSLYLLIFSPLSYGDINDDFESDEDFYYEDAFSGEEYTDTRPFFTVEALLGGQTLEQVQFENGETDSIRAGSGVYIALGIAHLMFERKMDIGIKGGYLFDLITAQNNAGEKSVLSFTRKPIDVFSHYWIDRHALGGGVTAHFDPVFTSRETSDSAKYRTAFGIYAEYLYYFTGTGSALGFKYLSIDYENKESGEITSGSAWGITFNQLF